MVYLVILLAGIILIGAGRAWYKLVPAATTTTPAGGAPMPPTDTIRTRVWTFVDTHWDKIVGTAAALLAVFLIIWMFGWMLPNVSAAYYRHNGWGYWLLALVATLILPALIWPGRVRKILLWTLGIFLAGVILPALLPAIWEVGFGGSSSFVPIQTAKKAPDPCDGIYKTYLVPGDRTIMPGIGVCRGIEWIVKEGKVGLFDKKGKELPDVITPDTPENYRTPPAVEWRALGNTARVHARLYH